MSKEIHVKYTKVTCKLEPIPCDEEGWRPPDMDIWIGADKALKALEE